LPLIYWLHFALVPLSAINLALSRCELCKSFSVYHSLSLCFSLSLSLSLSLPDSLSLLTNAPHFLQPHSLRARQEPLSAHSHINTLYLFLSLSHTHTHTYMVIFLSFCSFFSFFSFYL